MFGGHALGQLLIERFRGLGRTPEDLYLHPSVAPKDL